MATKSTRGRPKGSGIDDDKIIAKIIKLLAKDPDLKPTTAIKAVGINDASSIRRLRDKLKTDAPAKKKAAKKPSKAAKKTVSPRKAAAAKPKAKTVKTRKAAKPAKTAATTRKKAAVKKSVPTRSKAAATRKPTVKKTVATRTAAANIAAPKVSAPAKTVPTRTAPGKGTPTPADILNGFGLSNPFEGMTKGMAMPTEMADLNIENIVSTTVEKQIQLYESALKLSPMANILRQQALLTDMILTVLRTQKEFSKSMNLKG